MNTNTRVKEEARVTTTEQTATGKLSIIMFSGTADKFIPLGVISQAAAAMGIQVNIFVTGFALQGFTKKPHDLPFPTAPGWPLRSRKA